VAPGSYERQWAVCRFEVHKAAGALDKQDSGPSILASKFQGVGASATVISQDGQGASAALQKRASDRISPGGAATGAGSADTGQSGAADATAGGNNDPNQPQENAAQSGQAGQAAGAAPGGQANSPNFPFQTSRATHRMPPRPRSVPCCLRPSRMRLVTLQTRAVPRNPRRCRRFNRSSVSSAPLPPAGAAARLAAALPR